MRISGISLRNWRKEVLILILMDIALWAQLIKSALPDRVLILILMDIALWASTPLEFKDRFEKAVLILILMDIALWEL